VGDGAGAGAECVEDADGVDLGGQLADVVFAGPPEGRGLVVRTQVPAGGELVGVGVETGFLAGLAALAILYRFVQFQEAAGGFPVVVVGVLASRARPWSSVMTAATLTGYRDGGVFM